MDRQRQAIQEEEARTRRRGQRALKAVRIMTFGLPAFVSAYLLATPIVCMVLNDEKYLVPMLWAGIPTFVAAFFVGKYLSACPQCGHALIDPYIKGVEHTWWRKAGSKNSPYCCVKCGYDLKQLDETASGT